MAFFVAMIIVANCVQSARDPDQRLTLGYDLMPSYTAGWLVRTGNARKMYDRETVRVFEQKTCETAGIAPPAGNSGVKGYGPWLNPPFFAWLFVPLSVLPYRQAALAFLIFNLTLLTASVLLLRGILGQAPASLAPADGLLPVEAGRRVRTAAHLQSRMTRWGVVRTASHDWHYWGLIPLLLLTCMPFWQAMCHQQNTFLSLTLLCAAVTCWRKGWPVAAGIASGLLFFKPQLAAAVALVLIISMGRRAMLSLGLTGATLLAINLFTLPGTLGDFFHRLPPILHWLQNEAPYNWGRQVTFQSFWRLTIQGHERGETVIAAKLLWWLCTTGVTAVLATAVARHRKQMTAISRDRLIIASICAMPLLMPYYMDYDLVLLAVPATLLAAEWVSASRPPTRNEWGLLWSFFAVYWITQINPGLAGQTRLNLAVPAIATAFVFAARRCLEPLPAVFAAPVVGRHRMLAAA